MSYVILLLYVIISNMLDYFIYHPFFSFIDCVAWMICSALASNVQYTAPLSTLYPSIVPPLWGILFYWLSCQRVGLFWKGIPPCCTHRDCIFPRNLALWGGGCNAGAGHGNSCLFCRRSITDVPKKNHYYYCYRSHYHFPPDSVYCGRIPFAPAPLPCFSPLARFFNDLFILLQGWHNKTSRIYPKVPTSFKYPKHPEVFVSAQQFGLFLCKIKF